MKAEDRVTQALKDLRDHGQAAARLVARGKSAYDADDMLRYAAEAILIRMGEAVTRIAQADSAWISSHRKLALRKLKDSRNIIAHGYDIVDYQIVWAVLSRNVPAIMAGVDIVLSEMVPNDPPADQ